MYKFTNNKKVYDCNVLDSEQDKEIIGFTVVFFFKIIIHI